jgi:hypothetical protein
MPDAPGRILRGLRQQKRLDCPALVHCAVALRHLRKWQGQVKYLAGVGRPGSLTCTNIEVFAQPLSPRFDQAARRPPTFTYSLEEA